MVAAVLLTGGSSLAIAQNGPATGGERPVAGGANGGGWGGGWYGAGWYGGAPVYGYGFAYPRLYSTIGLTGTTGIGVTTKLMAKVITHQSTDW
jgi:hypothetical protein